MSKQNLLKLIAGLLIIGGIIRVFASENTFALFGIKSLWVDDLYFKYIFKVLGGFVILTGLILWGLAGNYKKYPVILNYFSFGFFIIAWIMLISGIVVKLPWLIFLPDVIFSLLVFSLIIYQRNDS